MSQHIDNTLNDRLCLLERSNRRLRLMLGALIMLSVGCAVVAWKPPDGDIEVRRLSLVDDSGRKRIELGMDKGKIPFIGVLDEDGHYRAVLMLDQVAALELNDETGHRRVSLSHGFDSSSLQFLDNEVGLTDTPDPRFIVQARHDDSTRLAIRNRPGALSVSLGSSRADGMDLRFSDSNGSTSEVRVGADGSGQINLRNRDGRLIWKAP